MSMFVRKGGNNYYNNNTSKSYSTFSGKDKECGHNTCVLTTSKCCACADRRPKQTRYTRYEDGVGYVTATRDEHYCPNCKGNVTNLDSPTKPQSYGAPPKPQAYNTVKRWPTVHAPPPPPAPPAPAATPTLSEYQMLATMTDMGFSYPAALKALMQLKITSPLSVNTETILNSLLEQDASSFPPPPPPSTSPPMSASSSPPVYLLSSNPTAHTSYPLPPPPDDSNSPFSSFGLPSITDYYDEDIYAEEEDYNDNNNNTRPSFTTHSTTPSTIPSTTPVAPITTPVTQLTSVTTTLTAVTTRQTNLNSGYDASSCVVCFNNSINSVVIPCGHLAMCFVCAQAVKKSQTECPVCRQTMTAVYQTFHV